MKVSTWKGGTYGVRVGRGNAREFFKQSWTTIQVRINGSFSVFQLSPTFWGTCPEFRGGPLPDWFRNNGIDKWPRGVPYALELAPLDCDRFELSLCN